MKAPSARPGSFRELPFHAWLRRTIRRGPGVVVGIGDDCAVLAPPRPFLLAKADAVVEGVHFVPGTPPRQAGWKAAGRSLSDVAAMGGRPRHALLALAVPPRWSAARVRAFVRGFAAHLARFGASLVGGDASSTCGPFVASAMLLGEPGPGGPILRRGARVGDLLVTTGAFGGSILGRHLSFTPRIREALALARRVRIRAAIDCSDGLALDLHRLCRASGVGALLDETRIPIARAARTLARRTKRSPLDHALGDGEDYELLLAIPRSAERALRRFPLVRVVGRFGGRGVRLRRSDGHIVRLAATGWEHGRSRSLLA